MDQPSIDKLSDLARIRVDGDDAAAFGRQLPSILDYVAQLQNIAADAMPALPAGPTTLRSDEARPSTSADDILALAPERLDRFWKVSSVLS